MSKMEYMPVDCLQVPKVLFQMEKYKNLSNTAKILYSLFLDRLKFAVQNGWVDHNGDLFVIYPKSEMKKDLNTTRYGVDQAVQELVKIGKLVRIVQNDGKNCNPRQCRIIQSTDLLRGLISIHYRHLHIHQHQIIITWF